MKSGWVCLPTDVEVQEEVESGGWRDLIKKWMGWVTADSSIYSLCLNSVNLMQMLQRINIIPQLNLKRLQKNTLIFMMTVIITNYPQQL